MAGRLFGAVLLAYAGRAMVSYWLPMTVRRPVPSFDSARLHAEGMTACPNSQFTLPTQCCRSALKKAIVQRASSAGGKKRSFLMVRCNPLLGRNCGKFQWGDVFITSERTCMHVSWLPSLMLRTSHDSESLYFTSEAC